MILMRRETRDPDSGLRSQSARASPWLGECANLSGLRDLSGLNKVTGDELVRTLGT